MFVVFYEFCSAASACLAMLNLISLSLDYPHPKIKSRKVERKLRPRGKKLGVVFWYGWKLFIP
jgi:hypothetical protein